MRQIEDTKQDIKKDPPKDMKVYAVKWKNKPSTKGGEAV